MPALSRASFLLAVAVAAAFGQSSPFLNILNDELNRNFDILRGKATPPPYFIAYSARELSASAVAATLGSLTTSGHTQERIFDVTVRVGSPKLDNYHQLGGERPAFASAGLLSIDDDPAAIKQKLWKETDATYRRAARRMTNIRTDSKVKLAQQDDSDDFSSEKPSVYVEQPVPLHFSIAEWQAKARKWSKIFAYYPGILSSSVVVTAERETKYFVNTEGTRIQQGHGAARISIVAFGKAADGMDLTASQTFEAEDPSGFPADGVVASAVDRVGQDLQALLTAPVVEPYVGPAILSGYASAVFFHEIFGHRIEGQRQKDESEGQTFTKKVGAPVLPDFLSVVFDPTRRTYDGTDLFGSYLYDDEGVQARRVVVVDHGILKTFLISRNPIKGFPHSNGHGRKQIGREVEARQSNLFVESSKTAPGAKLRQMLIEETRRQGKEYGLYFKQVTGGYTLTSRRALQAFTVMPILVYRIYADGRPDQLVRGADIVGTPLASFAKILATSDRADIFNGYCGAESGTVPVSAVSPALLVSEIEIQKKQTSQDRPPILPRPGFSGGGLR